MLHTFTVHVNAMKSLASCNSRDGAATSRADIGSKGREGTQPYEPFKSVAKTPSFFLFCYS
jgi:hypothetical protein